MTRFNRDGVRFAAIAGVLLTLVIAPRAYGAVSVTSSVAQFVTESGSVSRMYAALDPGNQIYLVVWSSFTEVTKGQFLNTSGRAVSSPFQIVPGASGYARVVRGANEFLVTYQRAGGQRWGRSVRYVNGSPEFGPEFFITSVYVDSDAGMAYVPSAGHYLVTSWNLGGGYRSYVTGVKADGTITIPTTWVTDSRSDTASPEIACDTSSNRCLMVGYGDAKYTWARFLNGATGNFESSLFTADSGSLQEDHNVEWNPTDQRYLLVYVRNRNGVAAKRLYSDMTVDPSADTVITGNYGQLGLGYNAGSNSFVATFKDAAASNLEYCWVQEFNGKGAAVSGQLFKVSTQATAGNAAPVVVGNPQRSEYLFVQTRNYTFGDAGVLNATTPDNSGGGGGTSPPPPPCTTSITPLSSTARSGGAFGSIAITQSSSSCTWQAVSNVGWITVAAASGTGSSTLPFTVQPNPTIAARIGAITVAGQVLTITQDGAPAVSKLLSTWLQLDAASTGDVFGYSSSTGVWSTLLGSGSSYTAGPTGLWATGWTIRPARFNNDTLTDFFLYRPSTGQWFKATNLGGGNFDFFGPYSWATGWNITVLDLNGDGYSDVFLYNASNGDWFRCITNPNGGDFSYFRAPSAWAAGWKIFPAEFNGDGRGDLFIYNTGATYGGTWFKVLSQPNGEFAYIQGDLRWASDWQITPGDFDGNGLTDLFLYRSSDGLCFRVTFTPTSASYVSSQWAKSWVVRRGDFNGDGRSDLLLYDPASADGRWVLAESSGSWFNFHYPSVGAGLGWMPYVGHLDSDRKTDIVWYRSSTGETVMWYPQTLPAFDVVVGPVLPLQQALLLELPGMP